MQLWREVDANLSHLLLGALGEAAMVVGHSPGDPELRERVGANVRWMVDRILGADTIAAFSKLAALTAALLVLAFTAEARDTPAFSKGEVLDGTVERVIDGDTFDLRKGGAVIRVRLAEIDAPEISQPHGAEAKRALGAMLGSAPLRVVVVDIDRGGRAIGTVFAKGQYVSEQMARMGHAWAYTKYAKSLSILNAEDEARAGQRGLWKLPLADRDAPWIWRADRSARLGAASASEDAEATTPTSCGAKTSCGEMESCKEARYYLVQCHLPGIDGDGDGIPCERLCGN